MSTGYFVAALTVLALLACQTSYGDPVSWYSCPATCTGECRCASAKSPVPNPPQFILLTIDDAVTSYSFSAVIEALKGLKNPNGCDLAATFYVSIQDSLDYLIQHLYMTNHEIADHTFHHPHYPDEAEMKTAIDWIHTNANVPVEEIRGFRAPYLEHDVAQRQTMYKLGLKYDASITEPPSDKQLFPYSLDHGVAVDCAIGTGKCERSESYPGMWSVPLWTLPRSPAAMDIPGDVFAQYEREFKRKLNDQRAPLGIFCHAGWLSTNLEAVKRFLRYALTASDDVWVVTNWQLIEWMKNPVSASEYRRQMTKSKFCPRSPQGPSPPLVGCMHGNWDKARYRCKCQGEDMPSSNGYCRDSQGSCQVPKTYTNGWHCPNEQSSPLTVFQNLAKGVEDVVQQHVPESVKKAVQDNVRKVLNQPRPKKLKKNAFYIAKNFGLKYDAKSGKHYFDGIEIPEHPLAN